MSALYLSPTSNSSMSGNSDSNTDRSYWNLTSYLSRSADISVLSVFKYLNNITGLFLFYHSPSNTPLNTHLWMYQGFYGHRYNPVILLNRNRSTIYYDAEHGYNQVPLLAVSIYSASCVDQLIYHFDPVYPVAIQLMDCIHASLEQVVCLNSYGMDTRTPCLVSSPCRSRWCLAMLP